MFKRRNRRCLVPDAVLFFLSRFIFIPPTSLCVCVCFYTCMQMCTRCLRKMEDVGSPEAGVKMGVSCPAWVLGMELVFSGGTTNTLNHRSLSPVPYCTFLPRKSHCTFAEICFRSWWTLIPALSRQGDRRGLVALFKPQGKVSQTSWKLSHVSFEK